MKRERGATPRLSRSCMTLLSPPSQYATACRMQAGRHLGVGSESEDLPLLLINHACVLGVRAQTQQLSR